MEALFRLGTVRTRVLRGGEIAEVDATQLVPGDIVVLEGGDIITADLRIIECSKLQADESALTGESVPAGKQVNPVDKDTVLAERASMLYKGTAVTRGAGRGVVVSTGVETELGHISSLVEEAGEEQTPLEVRLEKLGYRLITVTLVIAFLVTISGVITGKELFLMVETGIALAVAAIPEGLPIVATIALAKGLRIMARKNALINRLSSVETLGATAIICTDKTGTLTENRMTVTQLLLPGRKITVNGEEGATFYEEESKQEMDSNREKDLRLALETGVFCNNAALARETGIEPESSMEMGSGDPLEIALLQAGRKAGIVNPELSQKYPEIREESFDPEVKMMATWNRVSDETYRVSVKGAPGAVLEHCRTIMKNGNEQKLDDEQSRAWVELNNDLASRGLRMLALAVKHVNNIEGDPYKDLAFIGLVALMDPPRIDVKTAIERCRQAGIRVIMMTGDQVQTAKYIARAVGLDGDGHIEVIHGKNLPAGEELEASLSAARTVMEAGIFARINPRQKLDMIEFYQKQGNIVAMTGDGVNDAPALKKADIGIAMGLRGTQVAREASDMVLTDDAFSTIVSAIEQGRVIFGNIRRFIYYLMSCNVSEVAVVGMASLLGITLPILPLQILFLNLVTDVFPALALGVGEAEEGAMDRPPRDPDEPVLLKSHWLGIGGYSLVITISVLAALYLGFEWLNLDSGGAITLSFLTLAFAQLWHVFNMRADRSGLFDNTIVKNPMIWGALSLCVLLILAAVYLPFVAGVLQITPPGFKGWITVLGLSLVPLAVGQLRKGLI